MNRVKESSIGLDIDSLGIKETLMTRVNDALKEYKPESPASSEQNVSTLLAALLPPLISAVATSVSVAVGEILNKALLMIESNIRTQSASDPSQLSNIRVLTYENDKLQQYSRRENVRIFGIPVEKAETAELTEKKAHDLLKETGVNVTKNDISACHRVGRTTNGTRPVIVRFVSRRTRTDIMRNKKALRQKSTKIYINDDLTPLRAKLLQYVKRLHNTDNVWTVDGKIMCTKKTAPGLQLDNVKPVVIDSPDDLFLLGIDSVDWAKLGLKHLAGNGSH